ncbi:MAG TPA: HlyD family efflux transporter periplasmic adaptor subunit [Chloroflexia bacterium]|nr:HlyD family efflux transporter periplasmic adaptor subunit [Chloroflexia bacterium]
MDKPKDLVPAEPSNPVRQAGGAESAIEKSPASEQPPLKTLTPLTRPHTAGIETAAADSSTTALGRPVTTHLKTRKTARKRGTFWGWFILLLVVLAAGIGAGLYFRSTQKVTAFEGQTATVGTNFPVSLSISSSGQVQANADLSLSFTTTGTITRLNKKLGDNVQAGEVVAEINDSDLQNAVTSAQASYDQQQASYNNAIAGATQKELEQAQAQLDSARASLDQTVKGTFTAEDVASAQAAINSAAAKLAQDRKGGDPNDVAAAQSSISSAEVQLASAKAALAKTLAGSDAATIASAQATYDQALANFEKTLSTLKVNIVNAQVTRDQALNALKDAQDNYQAIYSKNRNADGSLKANLPQAAIDSETLALRSMQDAQGNYNRADMALNDANVALTTQTRVLQSQIDSAKANLDKVKAGPTQADIASAQAQVTSAQASLDNAKKTLAALTPTAAQIAADEAALASAQAGLAKLRGGTPDEVAQSQANLRSAEAALNDLKAGPKPNDVAIAKAQLAVSQAALDKAKAQLANALLKAPISGTIIQAPLTLGQPVTATTVVYEIVDLSSLHVEVNVGESDISKIKENIPVVINLDAISGRSFTGKVTFISSKATVTNNVTSYLTTVTLDRGSANSLFETYQSEFSKLLQGSGTGQGQRALATPSGNVATVTVSGERTPGSTPAARSSGSSQSGAAPRASSATSVCGYIFSSQNSTDQQSPKAGMTSNVNFCLNVKAGVLSVPNRAIKTKVQNGQQISYVEVLVDRATSKIEQRQIITGLVGDSYTEVTGGNIKEGDKIVISTTPTNQVTTTGGGGTGGGGGPRGP